MKLSLKLAQRVSNVDLTATPRDEIVRRIGAQLGAVEEVIDFGARYDGAVVARIVSCQDHPDADRLHVCRIDDGGTTQDIERGEDGLVQVVCGAPNAREGLLVAWLPPGTTVPASLDEAEPFVLDARPLRGVMSHGMLASPRELGLGDDHDGILEITEDTAPGTPLKALFDLDDFIIDCENKMFTHRPDCFGVLGVARELAGICGLRFESPAWYRDAPAFDASDRLPLDARIETKDVSRFMALACDEVRVEQSPLWLRATLVRLGLKPINNVVDITNYVMYLTGQPLHAYDYDKVARLSGETPLLAARQAQSGETLTILGGKTVQLDAADIVIATDRAVVGLGGVMGGADTEVDATTKRIILEVATFDMYATRRTSMRHGLFTEAVTRFNKGQSPLQNDRVVAYALGLLGEYAGAQQASAVLDRHDALEALPPVRVSASFINARLGSQLSAEEIGRLLENVEFIVAQEGDDLTVTVPFWRRDIELPEDIVEEVGRLYGLDKLPVELPKRSAIPARYNEQVVLKRDIQTVMASAGANEVLTYNFVHGNLLEKVGQNPADAYRLRNALSPQLQYYRLSLLPNLLSLVQPNIKSGSDEFAMYELGTAHDRHHVEDGLPVEHHRLAMVYAAKRGEKAPYYQVRVYLDYLAGQLGLELAYEPVAESDDPTLQPFESSRSAQVRIVDGTYLGVIGELRSSVRKQLKLPEQVAGFELDLTALGASRRQLKTYRPLSKYQGTTQDICFKVSEGVTFGRLELAVSEVAAHLDNVTVVTPIDIYRPEDSTDRHITFRIGMSDTHQTITSDDADQVMQKIAQSVHEQLGAIVV